MLPCNRDLLYEIFYVNVTSSQRSTKVAICYNNGIIVAAGVIIVGYIFFVVIRLPFDGYQIIWVDCGCLCQDVFCTPLKIAATSRFCFGLTSFVVTEAFVLVVLLLLICHSFTAYSLDGYLVYVVEYFRWVVTILLYHTTWWDRLCQPHFHFDLYLICLVLHGLLEHPYRGLICL